MSIKVKVVNYYRVFLVRKPLIGAVLAAGGGGGSASFKPPISQDVAGGAGGRGPIYGTSTEEIGFTRKPEDAFYQEGFVHVFSGENFDRQIFAALKDVHSVEFIPVYDETSL